RMTDAYNTLSKKQARQLYDEAQAVAGPGPGSAASPTAERLRAVVAERLSARGDEGRERRVSATEPLGPPAAPPPTRGEGTDVHGRAPAKAVVPQSARDAVAVAPEQRARRTSYSSVDAANRSRALHARKLAAVTGRVAPERSPVTSTAGPNPAVAARELARSLKQTGAVSGGAADRAARTLERARKLRLAGDIAAAEAQLRVAFGLAPDSPEIQLEQRLLRQARTRSALGPLREQAFLDETAGKWSLAAVTWCRVAEADRDDVEAHRRGADALLRGGGDLKAARDLALRACQLAPDDARARLLLGQIYIRAGLALNARRELELAAKLDPANQMVKNLLRELGE